MVRIFENQFRRQLIDRANRQRFNSLYQARDYDEIFNSVMNGTTLTTRQANMVIDKLENKKYIANIDYITYIDGIPMIEKSSIVMNNRNTNFLFDILTKGFIEQVQPEYGSDIVDNIDIGNIISFEIKELLPVQQGRNQDGGYFSYINTTSLDLSRYQIFNQSQAYEEDDRDHCLIHSLFLAGVEIPKLTALKLSFKKGANFRKKDLKDATDIIDKSIVLYEYDYASKKIKKKKIGNYPEVVCIALYENHFFIYEDTIYSKYFIDHYEELKDLPDAFNIVKKYKSKYYTYSPDRKINSFLMITKLLPYFKKLDMIKFNDAVTDTEHVYLDNIQNEQRLVEFAKPRKTPTSIFYADCESFVYKQPHELYLLGVVSNTNDRVKIFNTCDESPQQVVNKFLEYCSENNSIVYFHNLKYDYHLLEKYLNIKSVCKKDGQIYNVVVSYNKKNIELRDSYKLIPFALSKFSSQFNLNNSKKEAINYTYYTQENNNQIVDTTTYKAGLSISLQKIFDENIKVEYFNPLEYYKEYLELDCLVLKQGLQKFNDIVKDITQMTIHDALTISSLTDKYMVRNGAYNGVFEVKGNLRAYINKAVYGGRVAVNEKYKKQIIEGKISDYDGVSLYPSAIHRLCNDAGLPKGMARRIPEDFNYKNHNYSILTVKIHKVNKNQQIPFIAHRSGDSIKYLNEAPQDEIVIDSTTLQDYIDFHDIDYTIIDGVYWDSGVNKTMGQLINNLFNERLKYKKSNPALANVIKLMLNSAYGKTIIKKSTTQKTIIKSSKFDNYIYSNFNTIKSFRQINDSLYEVERLKMDDSYNRAHIGCSILSTSKRIMNEVFDIANDNQLPIYYTDTDSLHMNMDHVSILEQKYEQRYNKELNGKNLGQFHTDFDLDNAVTEIYAIKSIFLGKKSYIDILESTNSKGETINGMHIRLKGITQEGIDHQAKLCGGHFNMFKLLADSKALDFVLNPYNTESNSQKVLFEFNNGNVSTRDEFKRLVQF